MGAFKPNEGYIHGLSRAYRPIVMDLPREAEILPCLCFHVH